MTLIIAILALLVGAAFCFAGFRFFLVLLPIWAFLVGFNVGTDAISALLGDGSFATVTSWVVGLIVALVFAVLSYLFYWVAVVLLGAAVGYAVGVSAWGLIGNEYGLVAFVIGLICAFAVGAVTLFLNVPKYLVVLLTGLGGAAMILAGWFILIGKVPDNAIHWSLIGSLIKESWFYLIVFAVLAVAGIAAQLRAPRYGPDAYEFNQSTYRYS
ncbi:MAG: TM7S3/TM198-like domain-containing protein [Candidatus Limnocylindrales bacterium]